MNSFISWIGGKRLLKKKIIEQFPKEFDRYIEVFEELDGYCSIEKNMQRWRCLTISMVI